MILALDRMTDFTLQPFFPGENVTGIYLTGG